MGLDFRQGQDIFRFSVASRPALGPIQPPLQWLQAGLSPGIKRQKREADHSHPSGVEVKNDRTIPSLSKTSSWRDIQSLKPRDNFTRFLRSHS
jgi:hypothetical protein